MHRVVRWTVAAAVAATLAPASAFALCAVSACAPDGVQGSGAAYRVCMPEPSCWNGDLIVYAHGYVDFTQPLGIPEDQLSLPGGLSLPALTNALGFAFATTGYSVNGLAVQQGVADVRDLVDVFAAQHGAPGRTYLVGPSEGGIVTALAIERFPHVFSGGIAACGPIGSFQGQLNYIGDFRVVFDYFFPGVIPGSPTVIPDEVITDWDAVYVPKIKQAVAADPFRRDQLLAVTKAPFDAAVPSTKDDTIVGLLWYNAFGANDATAKLGGQPFDNRTRIYRGSTNDLLLNLLVRRFSADPASLSEVRDNYETSGQLAVPLVTLHTTGDPIIPFGHDLLYSIKTALTASSPLHDSLPVVRYGHCQFEPLEVLIALIDLVIKVEGAAPPSLASAAARTPDGQRAKNAVLEAARRLGGK